MTAAETLEALPPCACQGWGFVGFPLHLQGNRPLVPGHVFFLLGGGEKTMRANRLVRPRLSISELPGSQAEVAAASAAARRCFHQTPATAHAAAIPPSSMVPGSGTAESW